MIRFPITDLLNEQECYDFLLRILHPEGQCCPHGHPLADGQHTPTCATERQWLST